MSYLADLISAGEGSLISKVRRYAEQMGYARYTPDDPTVWQKSVQRFSRGIIDAIGETDRIPEISPDLDYSHDPISAFGIEQAKKHRSRGVTLEMFLGLTKYFRQSYQDLVNESNLDEACLHWAHNFISRYFDRIELGFISEWERHTEEVSRRHEELLLSRNAELQEANARLHQEVSDRHRAEEQVKRLNTELERRVSERTSQLQRLADLNDHKLMELSLLNRFSSINLSSLRLNKLAYLILATLTPSEHKFFDRAILFMVNERSETLQGMFGVMRSESESPLHYPGDGVEWELLPEEMDVQYNSHLSQMVRSCRLVLVPGEGRIFRAVRERKVFKVSASVGRESGPNLALYGFFGEGSYAVMPLNEKGRVVGLVMVDNPISGREIGRDDLRFLRLFSRSAGIAMENLMLFTRLEEANRKLNETQEQLTHGERLATLGEMAAGIAHELKGPMVSIGGFARRLARSMRSGSPEAQYVETIIAEGMRLEKLLTDILSFSRKTTICYDRCSIQEVVESALAMVTHALERNRIRLVKSAPRKEIYFYGDCQQLKQVFINLFNNAQEVMPGGGELRVVIASAVLGGEKAVIVKVADSGGGIPAGLMNNIFNPFFTTKASGTGLGLPIAARIISNHGGKLRAKNVPPGGAEFSVILPCRD